MWPALAREHSPSLPSPILNLHPTQPLPSYKGVCGSLKSTSPSRLFFLNSCFSSQTWFPARQMASQSISEDLTKCQIMCCIPVITIMTEAGSYWAYICTMAWSALYTWCHLIFTNKWWVGGYLHFKDEKTGLERFSDLIKTILIAQLWFQTCLILKLQFLPCPKTLPSLLMGDTNPESNTSLVADTLVSDYKN